MALTLPYPDMVFVPLDILTAEEQNQLVGNIEFLANQFPLAASNIADGAIGSDQLAAGAVKSDNVDWTTLTSNLGGRQGRVYLGDVKIQWGTTQMSMPSGQDVTKVVTFPEAFNHTPVVFANCDGWIAIRAIFAFNISTTQFSLGAHQVQGSQQNPTFDWLAIG